MRLFLSVLTVFLCILSVSAKGAFVEGIEDIPVPEGLKQIDNASLNFGNEEIRLIEVYLTAEKTDFSRISSFYKETLPQMGWQIKQNSTDKMVFEREGESLDIAKESVNPLVIRLTVKSKMQ